MAWNGNGNMNGFSKRGFGLPRANLDFLWLGSYDGSDLVNLYGANIPFVSGVGLDAIYDFSVLSDNRFDKGSYIGNSFGLPEYYNFPYVGIYYDPTTAATRKHWKLTDFAYAVILAQSITVDNMFFLKATATTDTSNVIASVQGLAIYSIAQVNGNLARLNTWMRIQADFYGNELHTFANAASDPNGNEANAITGFLGGVNVLISSQSIIKSDGNYSLLAELNTTPAPNESVYLDLDTLGLAIGNVYLLTFKDRHIGIGGGWTFRLSNLTTLATNFIDISSLINTDIIFINRSVQFSHSLNTKYFGARELSGSNDGGVYLDNLGIKQFFQNYYKS